MPAPGRGAHLDLPSHPDFLNSSGAAMSLPTDRKYTATHEWVKAEGDVFAVGITDPAQEQLGDLVFVGDVKVGARLAAGETAGVVESVKAASDIYAPVAGEIIAFNEALEENPALINESAHTNWIFKIKPDNAADLDTLLDAAGYEAL
jgi:glycine cleavage system H protein